MTIDAITGKVGTTVATDKPDPGPLTGSKDEFLKLFMAQLEHQDPLSPQDGTDMVAQLAQFSSVEQATQTNQHLIDIANAQSATSSASLSSLVGRDCNAAAADFQIDATGGAPPPLAISATGAMRGAAVVITDATGKEVRRIPLADGVTSSQVQWDGKDQSGNALASGAYHLNIEPGTTSATISAQWRGRVDAVELTSDGARLRMSGVLLAPAAIRTIGQTQSTSGMATAASAALRLHR